MKISEAQEQSITGLFRLDLTSTYFSHGLLYLALCVTTKPSNFFISKEMGQRWGRTSYTWSSQYQYSPHVLANSRTRLCYCQVALIPLSTENILEMEIVGDCPYWVKRQDSLQFATQWMTFNFQEILQFIKVLTGSVREALWGGGVGVSLRPVKPVTDEFGCQIVYID